MHEKDDPQRSTGAVRPNPATARVFSISGSSFRFYAAKSRIPQLAGRIGRLSRRKDMRLNDYVTLGRTGLRVSPLCFGAMHFGTEWGWGADETTSKQMFDRYLEAGGNFIDTADSYTDGHSEELVGKFVAEGGARDFAVVATKVSCGHIPGNPNSAGNGRKNIYRALEGSLNRLKMDYIDLYYLHVWDILTPVE